MEAEAGKVPDASHRAAFPYCPKGVGRIHIHTDASQSRLQRASWTEQAALSFHNLKNPPVVAGDSCQIHRDDDLGLFRDGSFQGVVVHLKAVLLAVHHHQFCPHMAHNSGGGGVGIGRDNHLVPRAHFQQPQSHLAAGSLGIEAHRFCNAAPGSNPPLKFLGSGAGGNPAGENGLRRRLGLRLGHIRGRKRNFHIHNLRFLPSRSSKIPKGRHKSEYYIAAWEKMQADRAKPPQFCSKNPAANLLRGFPQTDSFWNRSMAERMTASMS